MPPPASVSVGGELDLRALLAPRPDRRHVVSWYATAGSFGPFRVFEDAPATFVAPDAPATARIVAVVRDTDGGVAWDELTLEVAP